MTGSTSDRVANDALCGTHIDHSLLTGLCMYIIFVLRPSSASTTRLTSRAVLVTYPRDQVTDELL